MTEEISVGLRVYRGNGTLTPAQLRAVLAGINDELADPTSEASRVAEQVGLRIQSLELADEAAAFVAEA